MFIGVMRAQAARATSPVTISSAKNSRHMYMAIADTHVRSFYGSAIKRSEFWNTLLRLDRVMTLDDGRGRDKVDCLVGCLVGRDHDDDDDDIGDVKYNWILSVLERALEDSAMSRERVVGAVTIDGNYRQPGRRVRDRHAYIANLAVHPGFRRQGIAERLMVEAEARARDFDCDWAVLHVDERNTVGQQLYKKLGYRTVARQNWLEAVVEGRNEGERLLLLVKKL